MKRVVLSLLGLLLASTPSFAALDLPVDQGGNPVSNDRLAGGDTCVIDSSTGTAAVLCATGKGVVIAVLGSSLVATSDFITFRDSATANTTSAKLGSVGLAAQAGINAGPLFRFSNGLSANASAALGPLGVWTIVYRKR